MSMSRVQRALIALALAGAITAPSTAARAARLEPFAQQTKLALSNGADGDGFAVVAISGDTLVVGAPERTVGDHARQGAVYVFHKTATGWAHATLAATLTASDGGAGDQFGSAVALSGDTIVAGAVSHKVGSNASQGAAYVFVKPATGWTNGTQTAELTASDGNANDGFGVSVATDGNTIVAGPAQHQVDTTSRQGEAYAFLKPASGWANTHESAKLRASDGGTDDDLGRSVAVSGNAIVVGAPGHKVGGNAAQGAVYVFSRPPGMASLEIQRAELTTTDGGAGDNLGQAVAISGDAVVAGAPSHQVGLLRQGSAYVFARTLADFPSDITQTAELTAIDGATGDGFGNAVAVAGRHVVVGTYTHQVGPNQFQGAAYVFTRDGFVWRSATESAELTARDGAARDLFGITVAVVGDVIAAGGGLHPLGAAQVGPGAAYLFAVPPQVAISSPTPGATFVQGRPASASYACAAPPEATIVSCVGSVPNGASLDTGTPGHHSVAVNALDSDGATATATATYDVAPAVTPRAPSVTDVRQSAPRWRLGGKLARAARRTGVPVGTTFSFVLDQRATVVLRFSRLASGRPTVSGELRMNGRRGRNRIHFEGRLSRTRRLRTGRYMLQLTATNSARQASAVRSLRFRIIRG